MGGYGYSVLLVVGLLAGMWICERNSRNPAQARTTYLLGVWGGVFGSLAWGAWLGRGSDSLGISTWGFFLGAAAASVLALRWQRGAWELGDFPNAAAPAAALALSVARLGCFHAGCCFGLPADLPWAVRFGPETPAFAAHVAQGWIPLQAAQSLPVHPTQLYEAAATAVAFVVLQRLAHRPGPPAHSLMLGFGTAYGALRFLVGFWRHDGGAWIWGLSLSQTAALGTLALSGILLLGSLRRGADR